MGCGGQPGQPGTAQHPRRRPADSPPVRGLDADGPARLLPDEQLFPALQGVHARRRLRGTEDRRHRPAAPGDRPDRPGDRGWAGGFQGHSLRPGQVHPHPARDGLRQHRHGVHRADPSHGRQHGRARPRGLYGGADGKREPGHPACPGAEGQSLRRVRPALQFQFPVLLADQLQDRRRPFRRPGARALFQKRLARRPGDLPERVLPDPFRPVGQPVPRQADPGGRVSLRPGGALRAQ